MSKLNLCWFSCGVTSAVACKMVLGQSQDCRVIYIDTGQMHPDSMRFLQDCEKWFGQQIEIVKSDSFASPFDVWKKRRYLNGVNGAPCTLYLKKKVRYKIQDKIKTWDSQVIGFDISEKKRADRFLLQYPDVKPKFPLIENQLSKSDCMAILQRAGIEIPMMYKLGFHNNNCIGCCKGGKGYWSHIKKYFPLHFWEMAELERSIGASCINGCYLDELEDDISLKPIVPSCSLFCDPDFLDL